MLSSFLIASILSVTACGAAAPDETAARTEIGRTLDAIGVAVLAGDAESYLTHVSSEDREFFNEQKYFANDFRKKPPKEFQLKIGEGDFKIDDAAATCPLVMTWTMPDKKERSVKFAARFIIAPASEPRAWLYAGESWAKSEAAGVVVMHDAGLDDLAARTVEAFNAVRAHVEEVFLLTDKELPKKTQKIKLFGNMKRLQASISLSYEDGIGGWNEPGEPIKLLANRRSPVNALKVLLAHEYGHVATFELGPKANEMPWWLLEGVAEFSAEKFAGGQGRDALLTRWFAEDKFAPWKEIADFENTSPKFGQHVYVQGFSLVRYVHEKFGREKSIQWMDQMSNGATLDDGTRTAFGVTFEELDKQWRESLKAAVEEQKSKAG